MRYRVNLNMFCVYTGILLLLAHGAVGVFAQTDVLNLTDVQNGFRGTFKSGTTEHTVESSQAADGSLSTTIKNPEGDIIAEVTYSNHLVTVIIVGISISR